MRIIIAGPKAVGKTTLGTLLANRLNIRVIDMDNIIAELFASEHKRVCSCREIYSILGKNPFRDLEREAVRKISGEDWCIISTGGSCLLDPEARRMLRPGSVWLYLDASAEYLWQRLETMARPAFLDSAKDPRQTFFERVSLIREVLMPRCDCAVNTENRQPESIVNEAVEKLAAELASQSNSPNTFGDTIRLTTFGESHGPMIGAVLDGVPPGVQLCAEDIQRDLDRRRPGQSAVSTQRTESDRVEVVSGLFEGRTTGAPIALLIRNTDSQSKSYESLREVFRPGHADFTFWHKYGIRDHRGGGRSSGRETACRVAGGAIARKILADRGVTIRACAVQIGKIKAMHCCYDEVEKNVVRCPDPAAAVQMEEAIMAARQRGDSIGGIVQAEVTGLPAGLGDPVFSKLDARLGMALFSIGAVKGVEFGAGFDSAEMSGSQDNDQMRDSEFLSNNAGGIMGGISTGQPVMIRVAIKPTPSIAKAQKTCDIHGKNCEIGIEGRHDPCIVPRAIPVVESMIALVLLDAWEIQERIRPGWCNGK